MWRLLLAKRFSCVGCAGRAKFKGIINKTHNVSVNSKPDPPERPPGIRTFLLPQGSGFRSSVLPGGLLGGVLNQSKSSNILKKSMIFALSLKQLSSSSFHMFIYARSEQCDLVPIYAITNTQCIRIYPGKLKFILVKISSDLGQRKPKLYSRFLLSGLPCSHECKYETYSDLSSYAANLPG